MVNLSLKRVPTANNQIIMAAIVRHHRVYPSNGVTASQEVAFVQIQHNCLPVAKALGPLFSTKVKKISQIWFLQDVLRFLIPESNEASRW